MPKSRANDVPFSSPYRKAGWTVNKLKAELEQLGLPKSGTKQELIQRLEHAQGKGTTGEENPPNVSSVNSSKRTKDTDSPTKPKSKRTKISKEARSDAESELSLWTSPVNTVVYFFAEVYDLAVKAIRYALSHRISVALVATFLISFLIARTITSPYQPLVKVYEDTFLWYAYWIVLGIASSIGLGTGLHTFVLFLGPFIARVTMLGYECGNLNFKTRGLANETFVCHESTGISDLSMLAIYLKVMFESFAWGAGTAIGELPPYYVARAAALAGNENEEFDHIQALQQKDKSTLNIWEKIQLIMFSMMKKMGFFGILLSASIPNPLFDLAGITCGHFLVPFSTFFGATFIGKALIKASIQTLTIIFIFSRDNVEFILNKLKNTRFHDVAINFFEAQQKQFSSNNQKSDSSSVVSIIWNGVITLMIGYFLLSIVQSLANARWKRRQQKKSD